MQPTEDIMLESRSHLSSNSVSDSLSDPSEKETEKSRKLYSAANLKNSSGLEANQRSFSSRYLSRRRAGTYRSNLNTVAGAGKLKESDRKSIT